MQTYTCRPIYMTRAKICRALKRLRLSKPKYRQKSAFLVASGIKHMNTITDTESGKIVPSVETIDRWVRACGISLADFFASLTRDKKSKRLEIPAEYQKIVEMLLEALQSSTH